MVRGRERVAFSVLRFSVWKFSCCICLRCAFFTPFSNDSKKGDRTEASLFRSFARCSAHKRKFSSKNYC